VVATTVSASTLTSAGAVINVSGKTLSNLSVLNVVNDGIFGGTVYASNLNVIGKFTTVETTTSNTEQMMILNTGTGPALTVSQTGVGAQYSIAEFYDNESGLALKVADTGLVGIATPNPGSLLSVAGGVGPYGRFDRFGQPRSGNDDPFHQAGRLGIGCRSRLACSS
jgi:hypothetical protein